MRKTNLGNGTNSGSGGKLSNEDVANLLAKSNLLPDKFASYIDDLGKKLQQHGLTFVAQTLYSTSSANPLQDLSVPQELLRLVQEHKKALTDQSGDQGIRKAIIELFLRPELFGGDEPWNTLTSAQRKQIVHGGLTVLGPAILRSIPNQGSALHYWCNDWPNGTTDTEQIPSMPNDSDAPSIASSPAKKATQASPRTKKQGSAIIKQSRPEQPTHDTTAEIAKFSPIVLLSQPASLQWVNTHLLHALDQLQVVTVLDIANLDPVQLVGELQQDQKSAAPKKKLKKDESNGAGLDYLLASVRLLDEKSGNALSLLITPLSHSPYVPVLTGATIEALSKIKIPKAEIHQGQITQSKSGAKLPVNNGLRLLQLLINPEQAGISKLAQVIPQAELDKLNELFATVGIPEASSLSVKSDAASEMGGGLEPMGRLPVEKTRITGDFWNEFGSIELICCNIKKEDNQGRLEKIKAALKETPCPSYQDKYPPKDYPYLYNEQTKSTIASLNKLVSQLNQGIQNNTITLADIKKIYDAAAKLVYGEDTKIKWPTEWQ